MQRATARGTRDPLRRPPAPHSREHERIMLACVSKLDCYSSRRSFRGRPQLLSSGYGAVPQQGVERSDGQHERQDEAECRPGRPARRCSCSRCRWCCRTRPCPYPPRSPSRRTPPAYASAPRPLPRHCLHCRPRCARCKWHRLTARVPHAHRADRPIKKKPQGRRNPPANEAVTKWRIIETLERATPEEIVQFFAFCVCDA